MAGSVDSEDLAHVIVLPVDALIDVLEMSGLMSPAQVELVYQVAADRAAGEYVTTMNGNSYEVAYGYDATGNASSITAPGGVAVATTFQSLRPRTVALRDADADDPEPQFLPFGGCMRAEFQPASGAITWW